MVGVIKVLLVTARSDEEQAVVAQRSELLSLKQDVVGSIPTGGTR